jgi:hypothetical protein
MQSTPAFAGSINVVADPDSVTLKHRIVTLKIWKTIPKKSMGYQIYFLIIFILRTD